MKNKKNYWKTASIILGIIFIFLFIFNLSYTPTYQFGNMKISKVDFERLRNVATTNPFKICSLEINKCVVITKIK